MSVFFNPLRQIYRYRRIVGSTALIEIKKKYAGSILGLVWMIVYPLLFLAVYAMVYGLVFKVRYPGLTTPEYVAVIFSGLIVFLGFNESIVSGIQSVTSNSGLIKNTLFPIEMIPVRTVICSQITQMVGSVMLLVLLLFLNRLTIMTPLIVMIWALEIMMEMGLTWILSSINVIMKDLQNVIGLLMLLIMMASPIAYPVSMIPESVRMYMVLNPVYCFIIANQEILVHGVIPEGYIIIGMFIWGLFFFVAGYIFFVKMKRAFIDNV